MIFRIADDSDDLEAYSSSWNPKELQVEGYILPSKDSEDGILHESVFGEPLLVIRHQVTAKYKKRADILALDQGGSGVIIELKRVPLEGVSSLEILAADIPDITIIDEALIQFGAAPHVVPSQSCVLVDIRICTSLTRSLSALPPVMLIGVL